MKLVVDTNIVFSLFKSNSLTNKLLKEITQIINSFNK